MTTTGKQFLDALPGKGGVPTPSDKVKTTQTWKQIIAHERVYKQWLFVNTDYTYHIEYRDCDWFVAQYIAFMDRVSSELCIPSFAVAEVWYRPAASPNLHAVAVWLTPSGKLQWRETVPPCKGIRPTPQEQRSVCFRRV